MVGSKVAVLLVGSWAVLSNAVIAQHPSRPSHLNLDQQAIPANDEQRPIRKVDDTLKDVLDAIDTMQETYFDRFAGTWSDAIDWTAAVMGTHISATLNSIVDGLDLTFDSSCSDVLKWENLVTKYYTQTGFFYFGENAFGLQNQAYDDMLWVVLGWLESTKFADMYDARRAASSDAEPTGWHGLQLSPMAAHRARIFYELASNGWDDYLCGGGMTWNPYLTPYKNAITNELFTAASISMYLYFPGDNNSAPFLATGVGTKDYHPHDPVYLANAIKSYKWLKESEMRNDGGLYQDGFHITGWHRYPNGTINPGTGQCDELNTMVYTYNQGVLLTANRGLWLATGASSYLQDGHDLITDVMRATGWLSDDSEWHGLGRAGVMEDFCDHGLHCSQNGQTFKGIFFTHMAEFCRPLRTHEREILPQFVQAGIDEDIYKYHLARCSAYTKWIDHNAAAALATKNDEGLFGMWWGVPYNSESQDEWKHVQQRLPDGAVDHMNPVPPFGISMTGEDLNDRGRGRTVETQGSALAVLRAKWQWHTVYR